MREPGLREDKLDLAKREAFDGISRRNDEIGEIARQAAELALARIILMHECPVCHYQR